MGQIWKLQSFIKLPMYFNLFGEGKIVDDFTKKRFRSYRVLLGMLIIFSIIPITVTQNAYGSLFFVMTLFYGGFNIVFMLLANHRPTNSKELKSLLLENAKIPSISFGTGTLVVLSNLLLPRYEIYTANLISTILLFLPTYLLLSLQMALFTLKKGNFDHSRDKPALFVSGIAVLLSVFILFAIDMSSAFVLSIFYDLSKSYTVTDYLIEFGAILGYSAILLLISKNRFDTIVNFEVND